MKPDHAPPAEGAESFHTTHWTIVMTAVQSQAQGAQSALARLLQLYWYPLYVFVRLSGNSPDEARDLTQGFFLYLLEDPALTGIDRLKGKFRSFLLASLQDYLSNERARCLESVGKEELVHLDAEGAEERYRLEPVEFLTAEKIFNARWAMTVLGEAMNRLRQEYATEEKAPIFETVKTFLDPIKSIAAPSYEEAAYQLQVSIGGVKRLIYRLRKQYTALLHEEVGRTVGDPAEVDEEIRALCEALVASEGRLGSMKMEDRRTCSVCRTEFSANLGFCPVCVLRLGLDEPLESDESSLEKTSAESSPALAEHRFEHYELVKGEDGRPIELGRGAMGVTYKAFDVDLRCPVTLKVINERYLGDQSARLRFLREARAAASVRHPNVASVFHLGRSGGNYFYAMEFVDGETLQNLIKRSVRLEVKLALEIAKQVATGLAAVHKQKLVHRDIKPSNIMVSLEEGGALVAKIIDLGLAKAVDIDEAGFQTAISAPGAFAGTPEFASPEQFAGVQVDIRADLYSLGVTLWEMVTGKAPFRGSPAEVMYQHQHASLPLDLLGAVPQPVVVLLEVLLERDPRSRFQNPAELLKAMPMVTSAIDAGRRITRQSLQETPSSPVVARKPPARSGRFVSFVLGSFFRAWRRPSLSELPAPTAEVRSAPWTERTTPQVETNERSLGLLLKPWDFTPFLVSKLKGFTGRRWLFQEIDEWRARGSEAALLIIGEAGIGKSTIVAALIHENPGGQVLAYHCCRADTPATLEPAGFVRSLAAMLSAQLDNYAAMLEDPAIVNALQFADTDPASAFEGAILGPLHKLQQSNEGRRYLLIDALDEALTRTQRPTIVDVLSARLDRLPSWLGIVATTRSEASVLRQLGGLSVHTLSAEDPRNRDDVRHFIQHRLAEPALREKAQASRVALPDLEEGLLRSSAGNFLFVTAALDAAESGQFSFDQIEKLPPSLSSLYHMFFDRLFRDVVVDFGPSRRVLETVAAACEPLTREQIAAATGLDAEEELPRLLSGLATFVPACEGRYAFFHKSLLDWLTGWDTQLDRPFAGSYYVSLKQGKARLANWCWAEYQHGTKRVSLYCLKHLPFHLHETDRDEDARIVLLDFDFLRAKLEATDASALISDYEYFPEEADLRLIQSSIQLSANVLDRDPSELAGQMTGRLLANPAPDIQALLKKAAVGKARPWLQPLSASLTPPCGPLIRTLEGHSRVVTAVAVTPERQWVVSASGDCTLRIWELESGLLVRALEGHRKAVTAVAVTPDGRRAVSGSRDSTLRVWNLETGETVRTLEGHSKAVTAVAITPDGHCAVSASYDWTLRIWDLDSGQTVRTLAGHAGLVTAVAIAPGGRRAISASADRTLRVWDLESGKILRTLASHSERVAAVAITSDGRRALSASADKTLRLWELESGRTVRTLEGNTGVVTGVAITPDGRRAVSTSRDRAVRLWDLGSGQTMRTLEGHRKPVTAVTVTPDGCRAVSASYDRTLRVWDLERSGTVNPIETHTGYVCAVAVVPDGRRAVSASADRTLRVWDLESGRTMHTLSGHTSDLRALAVTPDGRRAVSASADRTLRVWDLQIGKIERVLAGHTGAVRSVVITPDARRALSAAWDRTLRVWDLESGKTLRTLAGHRDWVVAVAVIPEGHGAVSASYDRTLRVWDLDSGQTVHTLEGHTAHVHAVAVTPDGLGAVSASYDRTLRVWNLESGQAVHTLEGHTDAVTAVAITPDGCNAVSASGDRTLRVWDLKSGQMVHPLKGHTDWVAGLAITPDGHRAVSASYDCTLRVWDLASGELISVFSGESQMFRCAFAPDGQTIVAGDDLGRVHFLRLVGISPGVAGLALHHGVRQGAA
jgi:WD40 repeat protein/serine/threonine protein kinase/DNA-directed RNA polymerase specialized sigma24 family protein